MYSYFFLTPNSFSKLPVLIEFAGFESSLGQYFFQTPQKNPEFLFEWPLLAIIRIAVAQ